MVTECSDCRVHSLHSAVSAGWWQPARVGGSVVGCDREASAGVKRKGWDVLAAIGGGGEDCRCAGVPDAEHDASAVTVRRRIIKPLPPL